MNCVYCEKPIENHETTYFRGSQPIHKQCDLKLSAELDAWEYEILEKQLKEVKS